MVQLSRGLTRTCGKVTKATEPTSRVPTCIAPKPPAGQGACDLMAQQWQGSNTASSMDMLAGKNWEAETSMKRQQCPLKEVYKCRRRAAWEPTLRGRIDDQIHMAP